MFLFISFNNISFPPLIVIQIHLMFLFICSTHFIFIPKIHSNTSHVPIYRNALGDCCRRFFIQIHLMFLFISPRASIILTDKYSNTSHVPIYPKDRRRHKNGRNNSNTSHVPIYPDFFKNNQVAIVFKYISCSYLSGYAWIDGYGYHYSNTSHVPIYHFLSANSLFSCGIQIHLMFLFITDVLVFSPFIFTIQIHLMFLFICWKRFDNFKRHCAFKYISCSYLSCRTVPGLKYKTTFKYISCSYLSLHWNYEMRQKNVFKYISCSYLSVR